MNYGYNNNRSEELSRLCTTASFLITTKHFHDDAPSTRRRPASGKPESTMPAEAPVSSATASSTAVLPAATAASPARRSTPMSSRSTPEPAEVGRRSAIDFGTRLFDDRSTGCPPDGVVHRSSAYPEQSSAPARSSISGWQPARILAQLTPVLQDQAADVNDTSSGTASRASQRLDLDHQLIDPQLHAVWASAIPAVRRRRPAGRRSLHRTQSSRSIPNSSSDRRADPANDPFNDDSVANDPGRMMSLEDRRRWSSTRTPRRVLLRPRPPTRSCSHRSLCQRRLVVSRVDLGAGDRSRLRSRRRGARRRKRSRCSSILSGSSEPMLRSITQTNSFADALRLQQVAREAIIKYEATTDFTSDQTSPMLSVRLNARISERSSPIDRKAKSSTKRGSALLACCSTANGRCSRGSRIQRFDAELALNCGSYPNQSDQGRRSHGSRRITSTAPSPTSSGSYCSSAAMTAAGTFTSTASL